VDTLSLKFCLDRILRDALRCNDGVRCRKYFHIFTDYYCLPKTEESLLGLATGSPAYPRVGAEVAETPISIRPAVPCSAAAA